MCAHETTCFCGPVSGPSPPEWVEMPCRASLAGLAGGAGGWRLADRHLGPAGPLQRTNGHLATWPPVPSPWHCSTPKHGGFWASAFSHGPSFISHVLAAKVGRAACSEACAVCSTVSTLLYAVRCRSSGAPIHVARSPRVPDRCGCGCGFCDL